jgi:hypothetical protein
LSLTLFGCSPFDFSFPFGQPTEPVEQPTISADFSESFSLKFGQSAEIPSANLVIYPQEVLEDSRCPSAPLDIAPDCYWSGQVRLLLQIKSDDTYIENLEVSNITPSNYQDFQIILENITPPSLVKLNDQGEVIPVKIKSSEYNFTLKLEKL